jgi:RNA polymerase sigma factor (sigma-70 family)
LLLHFDHDLEQAGIKYELMREQLMKFFDNKGCISSPDLTDETINRVARKISDGDYEDKNAFSYYVYGVAKNVLREYLNSPERENLPIDNLDFALNIRQNSDEQNSTDLDQSRVYDCLEQCLEKTSDEDRAIIIHYYEGEGGNKIENRKQLATQLGLNLNNLRIRSFRIRSRLEKCVQKCLNSTKNE